MSNKLSMEDFMKVVKALKASNVPMNDCVAVMPPTVSYGSVASTAYRLDNFSLDTLACVKTASQEACKSKEQESKKMCYDCDMDCESMNQTDEAKQRSFLAGAISRAQSEKHDQLLKDFYINDDTRPYTAAEFIKRVQDGKFVLEDKTKDAQTYHAADYITWRDPAHPEDQDGFGAATKKLDKAERDADEIAALLPITDGYKALKDFQSATFH